MLEARGISFRYGPRDPLVVRDLDLAIGPGEVVWCPPGVKHWHGAAPGGAMTHLAVTGVADGKSVQWMERVSDAP